MALAAASPARLAWPTSIGVDAAAARAAARPAPRSRPACAASRRHARDRGPGGHRLDAADVAAMAARAVLVDADVADVAGRAGGAAVHLAVADDAAADAGADLDDEEVGQRALQAPELAERHQVDVVVDEDRRRVVFAQVVADREAVPVRHQRRVDELADFEVDRARHADADRRSPVAARSRIGASSSRISTRTRASTTPGPSRTSAASACCASTARSGRSTATSRLVAPMSTADQHAQAGVQLQVLGPSAAGGTLQAGLGQQALLDQAGNQRVGLALGEAQLLGHAMARAAGRPEGGLQQRRLVGIEAAPGCQASCLRLFFGAKAAWPRREGEW